VRDTLGLSAFATRTCCLSAFSSAISSLSTFASDISLANRGGVHRSVSFLLAARALRRMVQLPAKEREVAACLSPSAASVWLTG